MVSSLSAESEIRHLLLHHFVSDCRDAKQLHNASGSSMSNMTREVDKPRSTSVEVSPSPTSVASPSPSASGVDTRSSTVVAPDASVDANTLSDELARLFGSRDRITTYKGLILFDARLYIPISLPAVYLARLHESHQSVEKTRLRARQLFWWPGLSTDIAHFISMCDICIKQSAVKHPPYTESPLPSGPWEEIGTDVFVFEDNLYLILVCYYSRWIEVMCIANTTSGSIINSMKRVFSRLGVPKKVSSDNASYYVSREFHSFSAEWGLE